MAGLAAAGSAQAETRRLSFFYTHTSESLTVTFKEDGRFLPEGLAKLNAFLRDWRKDQPTKMDPNLFDILWEVYQESGSRQPIHVVSAYRSPETNGMLRSRSRGVAQFSQHTLGKAMDFRLPDVPTEKIRELGLRLQAGGVGFYPSSNFVHLDTGSVRHWPRMTRMQLAKVFPDGKTIHLPSDGKPLPGYELAAAEVGRRRSRFGGAVQTASADTRGGFIKRLFGGGADEEEEGVETVQSAAARPVTGAAVAAALPAPERRPAQVPFQTASSEPAAALAPAPEPRPSLVGRGAETAPAAAWAPSPLPEPRPVPASREAILLASNAPTLEARSDALRALITRAQTEMSTEPPSLALAMRAETRAAAQKSLVLAGLNSPSLATASLGPARAEVARPSIALRPTMPRAAEAPASADSPELRLMTSGSVVNDPALATLVHTGARAAEDLWHPVSSVITVRFTRINGVGPRTEMFQGPAVIPMPTASFGSAARLASATGR